MSVVIEKKPGDTFSEHIPRFLFITVGFYVSICFVSLFFLKSWYNVVIILLFLQWTFM